MLDELKQHLKNLVALMAKEIVKRFEPLESDVDAIKADVSELKTFAADLKSGKFDNDIGDVTALFGRKPADKGSEKDVGLKADLSSLKPVNVGGDAGGDAGGTATIIPPAEGDKAATTDPMKAGAEAAARARIEGGDVVTEAAKAAHAEAKKGGMSDLEANKAATDAAKAEGAGDPEAARAASNAALASA